MTKPLFPDSNDGQPVAERQNDLFDTRVRGDKVVESLYTTGLDIALPGLLQNMTIPQSIVGNDITVRTHKG